MPLGRGPKPVAPARRGAGYLGYMFVVVAGGFAAWWVLMPGSPGQKFLGGLLYDPFKHPRAHLDEFANWHPVGMIASALLASLGELVFVTHGALHK